MAEPATLNHWSQLALETLMQKPVKGIPIWLINPMEWRIIDRIAGKPEGTYRREPTATYRQMLIHSGCCMVDQWIPENPLTMGPSGFEGDTPRSATTAAETVVRDGLRIDSPESVIEHLERIEFPRMRDEIRYFKETESVARIVRHEKSVQDILGPDMLKVPYEHVRFPILRYGQYGYENYFMAYALYPDMMEKDFSLQADLAMLHNRAFVRSCHEGSLPPLIRLDHDMADSRGTLVDIRSLDRIWFPHFARSLKPVLETDIRMIWHCDGNLSLMVPRLLETGLHGFQGFQYEDGMDYEKICRMTTSDGEPLIIIAGVSVTRTLPYGSPDDVRREMQWLVDYGPKTGLFLGASSSIAPGVPWENIEALLEGFHYFRKHGRD
ncbi:MAG TPA: uroporphyrinogen decarboxylase family protein [bacterium]|nr:uroporphyrinogen decarboxylase family protein [bacterium]